MRRLSTSHADFEQQLQSLLRWDMDADGALHSDVRKILEDVRLHGDEAVLRYTHDFDDLKVDSVAQLELSAQDLQDALNSISQELRQALEQAAQRIRNYHQHQLEKSWSFKDEHGNELGQRIGPLQRVGVYVPGGQASYPSSVLMTLIPAKVAGVDEVIVTVPTPGGVRNDAVLAALAIAGADRVFCAGGAQAVAAMAFGTGSMPRVDKIVGPGGAYVAEAKRQVFGHVGIDIIAGPSEVLIIADGTCDVEWAVLDLFSQAEHDAAAQAILLSPDTGFLTRVEEKMRDLLPTMARSEIIDASLTRRGALIQTRDLAQAAHIANQIAPEHLELHVADVDALLPQIRHAGAIFCGPHASESLGDYVAGPSHVLPTFGTARFASPLGVYDFVKRSSVIRINAEGAAALADIAVPLADAEGLESHARAAAVRAQDLN